MLAAADSAPQRETDQELLCAGCGYPLRGLPDDGRCPECAFFVFRSRLIRERSGLSVEQRLRIRRSLLLVALSILTFLACVVAFIVAAVASAPRFIESAVGLLLLASAGLGVTGVFMATATTAGPAQPPSLRRAGSCTRMGAILAAGSALVAIVSSLSPWTFTAARFFLTPSFAVGNAVFSFCWVTWLVLMHRRLGVPAQSVACWLAGALSLAWLGFAFGAPLRATNAAFDLLALGSGLIALPLGLVVLIMMLELTHSLRRHLSKTLPRRSDA